VKQNNFPQDQIPASVLVNAGPVNLKISKSAAAPSPDEVARRAYSIYENQGSQPGREVKHWLEAEAQLFGGVERESQMNTGSPLFITEH
jgi:Protein of unknown function (DUF2934)